MLSGNKNLLVLLTLLSYSLGFSQTGPWNNPLLMARSVDGRLFDSPTTFQDSSGVPSAIRWKGDTLICAFQWFRQPIGSATWDRVAVKFSYDNGTSWTSPTPIVINGLPTNYQRPFDPTLAAVGPDSIRIYFSSSRGMPPIGLDSSVNTYSAVSTNAVQYLFDTEARVDHRTRRVIDPAVILFNGTWHYSSPIGAPQEGAYHYTSQNGILFFPQTNYPSDNTHNWTGNFLVDGSALRFYGSGPQIWYNTSTDGFAWSSYMNTNIRGGDPTVVKPSNSNYLMVYVGPPYQTGFDQQQDELPQAFALDQNFPNPFNPSTRIPFSVRGSGFLSLKVYDQLGREVRTLVNENLQAGSYETTFDGSGLASGVYFYRLQAGEFVQTKKLVVQK